MDLSIVIPAYNEEESLPELFKWIDDTLKPDGIDYEIIVIDDGSSDKTWESVESGSQTNPRVKGIKFGRNYGKSAALNEGFSAAKGAVVITMDADLQDSPEEIPELMDMINNQGFDLVSGWKKKRYDPITKTIPTKLFNWATRKLSGIRLHDFNCGLKAYRLAVVKNVEVYGEMHRYIPVLAKKSGFKKIGEKVVQHQARKYGKTKFGMERFINGFLDLLSITFVTKFGKRPMHIFGLVGTIMFFLGFCAALWLGINKLFIDKSARLITDDPFLYIGLTCMIIGTILFVGGFIAELVARNDPDRNHYRIDRKVGL